MVAGRRLAWLGRVDASGWLRAHGFLLFAGAIWLAPPLLGLAQRYWTTAQGAQGPIILVTGIWALAWQLRRHAALAAPGPIGTTLAGLLLAIAAYVVARMAGLLSLECLAAYGAIVAILHGYCGTRLLRRAWMPLVYLLAVVPPPYSIEAGVTGALKLRIATWSVDLLHALGLEVANSGSALYVDQYELLVEAACSGLNSIFSLSAIGLFYIWWQRRGDDWGRALLLTALIVPIAILANLGRVMLLLLLVHWQGDRVLAGSLHPAIGFFMFAVALGLVVALDTLLRRRAAPAEPVA